MATTASNGVLELTIEDEVAEIRMTDAERRNCVSFDHVDDLFEVIDELEARKDDGELSAIVVTHEGPVFCAGYDMDVISDPERNDEQGRLTSSYGACRSWLTNVDVPVVVGAKGPAVAAGAGHFEMGDITVVGPEFRIWWPEINVGLFPYAMGPNFIEKLGVRRAAEVTFLGNEAKIDPEEARELGLVNRIVDADAVDEEVRDIGRTLARYEREHGYMLDAYEIFNLAKRADGQRGGVGPAQASWQSTYDQWFGGGNRTTGGGREDPRS